jgi:hypothetical protein
MRARLFPCFALFALLAFTLAQAQSTSRQIAVDGVAALSTSSAATDTGQGPEIDVTTIEDDAGTPEGTHFPGINRTIARGPGSPLSAPGHNRAKSNPEMMLSFHGLDHFAQRFGSGGGNQFSIEPPDQGLCAGNGFVMETVNDVLAVYDTAGNLLGGPTDLNTFYGYPHAIYRSGPQAGQEGPEITDPSCLFDSQTQRWFHVVLTLDRASLTNHNLTGSNHLDIAVSDTPSPLGTWHIYRVAAQDDGTQGTPDHHCPGLTPPFPAYITNPNACFGDYPHIGADANGFYITTNEFPFFPNGFIGAQIYAFSKSHMAAGLPLTVVQFNTADPALGVLLDGVLPGFTVWPAVSTGNQFEGAHGGTEFLLSSEAVFQDSGVDNRLRLWSLTNTSSLNSATPAVGISIAVIPTIPYAVPGRSNQKAGDVPLATCLSDSSLPLGGGLFGCWQLVVGGSGPFANTEKLIESNDSRMQQVALANGKLWAALDTGLLVNGAPQSGVAYFVIDPHSGNVAQQGYVGVPGNNLTYPAVAVTQSGRGVMAFTVLGNDFYPSAGYAGIDAKIGVGDVHIAAAGAGPDDGFTGYHPFGAFSSRPRWGDYGAAVSDGNSIWIGSEYINQTCTYMDWLNSNFRCGNTRTQLANWGTRLSLITP